VSDGPLCVYCGATRAADCVGMACPACQRARFFHDHAALLQVQTEPRRVARMSPSTEEIARLTFETMQKHLLEQAAVDISREMLFRAEADARDIARRVAEHTNTVTETMYPSIEWEPAPISWPMAVHYWLSEGAERICRWFVD
jgi:6-pyruvoyl-tetrahydropterin synthase